jgi:hypothetical protein
MQLWVHFGKDGASIEEVWVSAPNVRP